MSTLTLLRIAATFACLLPLAVAAKPAPDPLPRLRERFRAAYPASELTGENREQKELLAEMCRLGERYPKIAQHLQWLDFSNSGLYGRQLAVTVNNGTVDLNWVRFGSRAHDTHWARHEFGHLVLNVLRYLDDAGVKEMWRAAHFRSDEDWAEAFEEADTKPRYRPKFAAYIERWRG